MSKTAYEIKTELRPCVCKVNGNWVKALFHGWIKGDPSNVLSLWLNFPMDSWAKRVMTNSISSIVEVSSRNIVLMKME